MTLPVLRTEPSSAPEKKRTQARPTTGRSRRKHTRCCTILLVAATKGRTMYVIPYSMGPVGSPLAKIGVELTDSIYVVLNMAIMTRVGQKVMDVLGDSNDLVRGLHSKCDVDPEKRYICPVPGRQHHHAPSTPLTAATFCSARSASRCVSLPTRAKNEGWMAEHMLILGIENPKGEVKYICAAFPSACGKTNLAMLIPPEGYREEGLQGLDRRRRHRLAAHRARTAACGPSTPKTASSASLPARTRSPTRTLCIPPRRAPSSPTLRINLDDNTVWWEGLDKNPPEQRDRLEGQAMVNGQVYC